MKKRIFAIFLLFAAVCVFAAAIKTPFLPDKDQAPLEIAPKEPLLPVEETCESTQTVIDTNNEYAFLTGETLSTPGSSDHEDADTKEPAPTVKNSTEQITQKSNTSKPARVIHHDAEYTVIHHDAVTIHHEAEYKTIHHEEEGHYEESVVSAAWDESVKKEIVKQHVVCNEASCSMDFTDAGYSSSQIWDHLEAHALKGEASGHHTEDKTTTITETVHHDAQKERVWVVDREAWDEKVLVKDAWDEVIPAYDERVLVREAWDEMIPE